MPFLRSLVIPEFWDFSFFGRSTAPVESGYLFYIFSVFSEGENYKFSTPENRTESIGLLCTGNFFGEKISKKFPAKEISGVRSST